MPAAGITRMLCCVFVTLFSLLAIARTEPCGRLYLKGLDSTTTFYPQLAGVYKLQMSVMSEWMTGYPIYVHELDELFLYYNSSQRALMIGPLHTHGLLKVQKMSGVKIAADADYSRPDLFTFSVWKQWDPRPNQFIVDRKLSQVRPQCVDENVGYCSSGSLHPSVVHYTVMSIVWDQVEPSLNTVDFQKLYFRLLDGVFYNYRPVYELLHKGGVRPFKSRQYVYHKSGKWRVHRLLGSDSYSTGVVLELESNATRLEYETEAEWYWIQFLIDLPRKAERKKVFGHLLCSRQLPDGAECSSCDNGGTCRTEDSGVSLCYCAAGYRGIQCTHNISQCALPFPTPPLAISVFGGPEPHYEGSLTTVFCSSDDIQYSLCQNGSWQSTRTMAFCYIPPTTTTTTTTTTRYWLPVYNESADDYIRRDSFGTIATVVVAVVCVQLGFPFLCYCCIVMCQSDEDVEATVLGDDRLKSDTKKRRTSLQRTCSGFFYLCWWVWLVVVIVYFVWYGYVPLDGSTVFSAVVIMAFVFLGVLYCCVFSESLCSREYNDLTQLENEEVTVGEKIAEMKAAKPNVTFRAECSHDETRTRTRHDSIGSQLETYKERVKGAVIEEPFIYSDCFDNSGTFEQSEAHVTRVHVELVIDFADEVSKRVYEDAYEAFKARHLTRDQFVEFSINNDLPGFVKKLAVHDPDHEVPSWLSSSCFCLASCCCLTWPYRWLFKSAVSSYSYCIVKKIVARPVPVINQPQSVSNFQSPPAAMTLEPCAPPLPDVQFDHHPDDVVSIPPVPSDLPAVPPPSYYEFTAHPELYGTPKHAMQESIPMSEMKM